MTRWMPLLLVALLSWAAPAQEVADDFRANCASCHTIGGGARTGPDLKDVEQRQSRDWLTRFIVDPPSLLDSGDPYAKQLLDAARGSRMPAVSGMTPERAAALLDLIAAESALEASQFSGMKLGDEPFTAQDVARGRALFTGRTKLTKGGPPCLSCHTTGQIGGLGGGRLAPDLTRVEQRPAFGSRQALATWLQAPPTPTMKSVYGAKPLEVNELLPLIAFIEYSAGAGGEAGTVGRLNFLLLGIAGCVAVLLLFDSIWKTRFRAVRRPLVERVKAGR